MSKVNAIGAVSAPKVIIVEPKQVEASSMPKVIPEQCDEVSISLKKEPNIGFFRLATGFLTDEQIKQINETGRLPKNAKFISNGYGGYFLANNFFGIRPGTQKIPEGFEVKKGGILGQVIVVPKGTEGLFIRNAA